MQPLFFPILLALSTAAVNVVTAPPPAIEILRNFTLTHIPKCGYAALPKLEAVLASLDLQRAVLYLALGGACADTVNGCSYQDVTCVDSTLLLPLRRAADGNRSKEWRRQQVDAFVEKLSSSYTPNQFYSTQQQKDCWSGDDIVNELGANQSVALVYNVVANHLLTGDCLMATSTSGYHVTSHSPLLNRSVVAQMIADVNSISRQCQCTSGRCRRHAHSPHSQCLNADSFVGQSPLDIGQLTLDLCPPLIQQLVTSAALSSNQSANSPSTSSLAYLYGTIAVAIISLTSVLGVVIIPCLKSRVYAYVMTALIGMGFGILTGDAVLHLMPQALGLHAIVHEEGEGAGELIAPYLAKCMAILGAIYALFLFESLTSVIMPGHSHDHAPPSSEKSQAHGRDGKTNDVSVSAIDVRNSLSQEIMEISEHGLHASSNSSLYGESSASVEVELAAEAPVICCQLKSLALVITLGDTVHNFADGLIVGAAFASGTKNGISSALAIFCHEIPHELGDFAILLSTGLSRKKVIIVNLLSSLSSFAGLYIGVLIGSNESAVQWTLAMTAGLFLFVALGDMMPELKQLNVGSQWKRILTQNLAVLSGMIYTVLISIYEDQIRL